MDLINETFEEWKPVFEPFAARYEVSNRGRVRDLFKRRYLKQTRSTVGGKLGYMKVTLRNGDLSKFVSVHRLVATAFVPGDVTLDVNHLDLDKKNNLATNLAWVTHGENIRHGLANHPQWLKRMARNSRKRRRAVRCVDVVTGERATFHSIAQAAQSLGHLNKAANIHQAINIGRAAYGKMWFYVRKG